MKPSATQPTRIVRHPPPEKPLLIFDGDCGFCRRWIARWQASTGDRVDFSAYQEVEARFPEIPRADFEQAVQLIEPDGRVESGADAVFRIFDFAPNGAPLLRFLRQLPGFMPLARIAYRVVAANRAFFSRFS
jgi:predicted DCC family thiol-disulfide oxidoreductase YuxK